MSQDTVFIQKLSFHIKRKKQKKNKHKVQRDGYCHPKENKLKNKHDSIQNVIITVAHNFTCSFGLYEKFFAPGRPLIKEM